MEEPMNMNGKYTSKGNDKYEDRVLIPYRSTFQIKLS